MAARDLKSKLTKKKRILIVDDHAVLREGLVAQINRETDLVVGGEASDARHGLSAAEKLKPDLVLADITLPGRNGLELIRGQHQTQIEFEDWPGTDAARGAVGGSRAVTRREVPRLRLAGRRVNRGGVVRR